MSSEAAGLSARELGLLGGGSGVGDPGREPPLLLAPCSPLGPCLHTPAGAADLGTPNHGPACGRALRSGFLAPLGRGLVVQIQGLQPPEDAGVSTRTVGRSGPEAGSVTRARPSSPVDGRMVTARPWPS